ncbi:MAG: FmdB family zinc ribbon protein [Pyrinomonadaceae bacterium]
MPIYEYKCKSCESHFETRQKVSDEPLKVCESCGGELEKQWSRTGFQFKGDGWYVTDYAGKGKSNGTSSSGESTGGSDAASKAAGESSGSASSKGD